MYYHSVLLRMVSQKPWTMMTLQDNLNWQMPHICLLHLVWESRKYLTRNTVYNYLNNPFIVIRNIACCCHVVNNRQLHLHTEHRSNPSTLCCWYGTALYLHWPQVHPRWGEVTSWWYLHTLRLTIVMNIKLWHYNFQAPSILQRVPCAWRLILQPDTVECVKLPGIFPGPDSPWTEVLACIMI